jgi:putative transposase
MVELGLVPTRMSPTGLPGGRWPWGSLFTARDGKAPLCEQLGRWPVAKSRDWLAQVNRNMSEEVLERVRLSVARNLPLGTPSWRTRMAARLGLQSTLRLRGRPPKKKSS